MRIVKYREERRQEIIDTAKRLFLEYGTEHTSISQLVKEVGVAHGLFYYYFKSKEEVMASVLEQMIEEFRMELKGALSTAGEGFYQQLMILINAIFDIHTKNTPIPKSDDWMSSHYHDRVVNVLNEVGQEILAKGIAQGHLKIAHPDLVFQMIIGGSVFLIEKSHISRGVLIEVITQILGLPENCIG